MQYTPCNKAKSLVFEMNAQRRLPRGIPQIEAVRIGGKDHIPLFETVLSCYGCSGILRFQSSTKTAAEDQAYSHFADCIRKQEQEDYQRHSMPQVPVPQQSTIAPAKIDKDFVSELLKKKQMQDAEKRAAEALMLDGMKDMRAQIELLKQELAVTKSRNLEKSKMNDEENQQLREENRKLREEVSKLTGLYTDLVIEETKSKELISSLLFMAGIEQHPGPVKQQCSDLVPRENTAPQTSDCEVIRTDARRASQIGPSTFQGNNLTRKAFQLAQDGQISGRQFPRRPRSSSHGGSEDERSRIESHLVRSGVERHPGPVQRQGKPTKKPVRRNNPKTKPAKRPAPRKNQRPKPKAPKRRSSPRTNIETIIAMGYADPTGRAPIRYADEYANEPTSVTSPWCIADAFFNTASLTNEYTQAFLFRDISRLAVIEAYAPGSHNYTWNMSNGSSAESTFLISPITVSENHPAAITFCTATPGGGIPIHGEMMFGYTISGKQSEEQRWIYMDAGGSLYFNYSFGGTYESSSPDFQVTVDRFTNSAQYGYDTEICTPNTPLNNPNGTFEWTATLPGYYAFTINDYVAPGGFNPEEASLSILNVQYDHPGTGTVWRHLPLPGIGGVVTAINQWRMLGSCIFYRQYAAPDDRAGSIAAGQIHKSESWFNMTTPGRIKSLQGTTRMNNLNGVHAFYKPTSEDVFDMQNFVIKAENGTIGNSFATCSNLDDFIAIELSTPTPASRNGEWEIHLDVEFTTENVNWPIAISAVSPSQYRAGLAKLRNMANVHENPSHVHALLSEVGGVARRVAKNLPGAIRTTTGFARDVQTVANMVKTML